MAGVLRSMSSGAVGSLSGVVHGGAVNSTPAPGSSSSSSSALVAHHHGCHVAIRQSSTILRSTMLGAMNSTWRSGRSLVPASGSQSLCARSNSSTGSAVPIGIGTPISAAMNDDEYEVEMEKPIGLKFYRGADGATYIDAIAPGGNADRTGLVEVGDKVVETSATFGTEMWPAAEYGRTMYAIKTRIGTVALKMQKKYGERQEVAGAPDKFKQERKSGNYEDGTKEIQYRNYMRKQEEKQLRKQELSEGLRLYKSGKYEEALIRFETVLGLKPDAAEEGVASYNVACCYSKLNQIDAALGALDDAMAAGFEDYKMIRTDSDLDAARKSPKFGELIDKYDEPFINENAVAALKGLFGMFGKK